MLSKLAIGVGATGALIAIILMARRAGAAPNTLRNLAKGFQIGVAISEPRLDEDPLYSEVAAREYNIATTMNALKFTLCHGKGRDIYTFDRADHTVNFARQNKMKVRGHTLIKGETAPYWLTQGTWTREELIDILIEHVSTVVGYYKGKISYWDVVNEAMSKAGVLWENNFWYKTIGPEYIDLAFLAAREADPGAKLFYNDFRGEAIGDEKADGIYNLVSSMLERGIPIDGVGMQMHVNTLEYRDPAMVAANMDRLAELGLEVQVTEMTVIMPSPPTPEKLGLQAQIYGDILEVCLSQPACTAFVMWMLTDKYVTGKMPEYGYSTIFDENYQPKPAYYALQEVLQKGG